MNSPNAVTATCSPAPRRSLVRAAAASAALFFALAGSWIGACGDEGTPPLGTTPDAALEPDASTADAVAPADPLPVPRGARTLGVTMAIGDTAFANNVQVARDAGAGVTNVSFAWDDIERTPDADPDASTPDDASAPPTQLFNPLLHIADLVLPSSRVQALLSVEALDVGGSRAPADLAGRALDDGELGARYDRLTEHVLRSTPDLEIAALFVATDVDLALGDDTARYEALATFVTRAAAHARALRPGLKVGFTVTAAGAASHRDRLAAAWAASDVIGITYLPADAAFRAQPPGGVAADLDRLVALAPVGKPIVLREAGYPTSPAAGGDEAAQAAFVAAVFAAWDRHADRIPFLTFRELDDASPTAVSTLAARHRRTDAPFLAFLGSLGLRTADGRTKPAFEALIGEARARRF